MKLKINENVITDYRNIGLSKNDEAKVKYYLNNHSINLESSDLVEMSTADIPSTYAKAKKSENYILAVTDDYGELIVLGIFGDNYYYSINENSVRRAFELADKFYEVIPQPGTKSRFAVRKEFNRDSNPGSYVMINDNGTLNVAFTTRNNKGFKYMVQDKIQLYNPEVNSKKYIAILEQNHKQHWVDELELRYDQLEEINNMIASLLANSKKFVRYKYMFDRINKYYTSLVNIMYSIECSIDALGGGGYYFISNTEQILTKNMDKFDDTYSKLISEIERFNNKN